MILTGDQFEERNNTHEQFHNSRHLTTYEGVDVDVDYTPSVIYNKKREEI